MDLILGKNAARLYRHRRQRSDRHDRAHARRAQRTRADDPFSRYGLRRLVNASGTETTKGASPVCPEVIEAVAALVPHSVEMIELQSVASATIARVFGSEAGVVVNCSAAGISICAAATMTGLDLAAVERLPDTTGLQERGGPAARPQHHVWRPRHPERRTSRAGRSSRSAPRPSAALISSRLRSVRTPRRRSTSSLIIRSRAA